MPTGPKGFFDTFNLEQVVPLAMKKFDIDLARRKLGMEEEVLQLKKDEIKRSILKREAFTNMLMPILTGQGETTTPSPSAESAILNPEQTGRLQESFAELGTGAAMPTATPNLEQIMPTSTELPKPSHLGPKGIDPNKAILSFLAAGGEPKDALTQIVGLAKAGALRGTGGRIFDPMVPGGDIIEKPPISKLLTPEEEAQQIRIAAGKAKQKPTQPTQYSDKRNAAVKDLQDEGIENPDESEIVKKIQENDFKTGPKVTLEENKEASRQELLDVLSKKNLDFPLSTKDAEAAIPKDILRRAQSVGVLAKDFQGNKYQWAGQQKESPWMAVATGEKPVGTPEQINTDVNAIMNYQTTLQDVQSGGGMGGIGAAYGRQLRTEIIKRDPNFNFALQKLYFSGDQSEVRSNKTLRGKIAQFEETAIQNAKQVYLLSSKIDVTKIPILNSLILKGETHLAGDPVASNYLLAWRTFINEYARVATTSTGAGVTSDQARKEMETAIKSAYTPEQIQALMRQATLEMKHRIYGFDKSLNKVLQRWGETEENAPRLVTSEDIYKIFSGYTPEVTPPKGKTEERKTIGGKGYIKQNGKWYEE